MNDRGELIDNFVKTDTRSGRQNAVIFFNRNLIEDYSVRCVCVLWCRQVCALQKNIMNSGVEKIK